MCVSLHRALSTQNECAHHRLETVANLMGMYERAMLHFAAKQQKLKWTEKKLEPTFTPETNKSRSSSHSGSNIVSDRLSEKNASGKANHGRSSQKRSPTRVGTRSWESTSSRIDHLYRDGLRRAQNRALTDRQDDEQRRRRLEEKELEHCTFRPNMDWRKKKPPCVGEKPSPNASKDMPHSHSLRTHRSHDSPAIHIITTRSVSRHDNHSFATPPRGQKIIDRTCDSNGTESVDDATEYGSI
jgi:hypothetical protein